jgi:hypothetical protein
MTVRGGKARPAARGRLRGKAPYSGQLRAAGKKSGLSLQPHMSASRLKADTDLALGRPSSAVIAQRPAFGRRGVAKLHRLPSFAPWIAAACRRCDDQVVGKQCPDFVPQPAFSCWRSPVRSTAPQCSTNCRLRTLRMSLALAGCGRHHAGGLRHRMARYRRVITAPIDVV